MKIGILTYCSTEDNYGQILQCYALQQELRQLGHSPELIQVERDVRFYLKRIWGIFNLSRIINHIRYIRLRKSMHKEAKAHPRHFGDFRNRYIEIYPTKHTTTSLYIAPPKLDCVIVGSDQVWNNSPQSEFFLDWVPEGTPRISYAASFGGKKIADKEKAMFRRLLSKFDAISVRESDGIDICNKLGIKDVSLSVDPTLLLERDDYLKLIPKEVSEKEYKPFLLIYFLGSKTNFSLEEVYQWALKRGLDVKYIGSQGKEDHYPKEYATLEEWLDFINKAEYVVTNSFHGTVFSIIMETSFMTVPLCSRFKGMNRRIVDLLNPLGLSQQIYDGTFNPLGNKLDFTEVRKRLMRDKKKSKMWLKNSLIIHSTP